MFFSMASFTKEYQDLPLLIFHPSCGGEPGNEATPDRLPGIAASVNKNLSGDRP